jgi:hypothetical protein
VSTLSKKVKNIFGKEKFLFKIYIIFIYYFKPKTLKFMSKLVEAIETYVAQSNELNLGLSEELITLVAKGLGPSIYNADSSKVSSSDPEELARVKTNYLIGKLGLPDGPELDMAIAEVMEKMGSSNRNKYRANVYALLCKKFGKEDIYA